MIIFLDSFYIRLKMRLYAKELFIYEYCTFTHFIVHILVCGGEGDAGRGILGRGAVRGKRVLLPEIQTRPANLVTKKG